MHYNIYENIVGYFFEMIKIKESTRKAGLNPLVWMEVNEMDKFMKRAVKLASENVRGGGQPFSAVLVNDDGAIVESVNELHKTYDVSGHAEMLAIRKAQKELQTNDLSDYIMYASGEPCPMCLTAIYYVGIKKVYYCLSLKEAVEAGLGEAKVVYEDLQRPKSERTLPMIRMQLKEQQHNPIRLWKEYR